MSSHFCDWSLLRPIPFHVPHDLSIFVALQKVKHIIQYRNGDFKLHRRDVSAKNCHIPTTIVMAAELKINAEIRDDIVLSRNSPLPIHQVSLLKNFQHHLLDQFNVHGLINSKLHIPRRVPETRWNVHHRLTVPVYSHPCHFKIFQNLIRVILCVNRVNCQLINDNTTAIGRIFRKVVIFIAYVQVSDCQRNSFDCLLFFFCKSPVWLLRRENLTRPYSLKLQARPKNVWGVAAVVRPQQLLLIDLVQVILEVHLRCRYITDRWPKNEADILD